MISTKEQEMMKKVRDESARRGIKLDYMVNLIEKLILDHKDKDIPAGVLEKTYAEALEKYKKDIG